MKVNLLPHYAQHFKLGATTVIFLEGIKPRVFSKVVLNPTP